MLDHLARRQRRGWRPTNDRSRLSIEHPAVTWTDDLASLIPDRATGMSADSTMSNQDPVGLADDDVKVAGAWVWIRGSLPRRQPAGGAEPDSTGRNSLGLNLRACA